MTKLYSFHGQEPDIIPERIRLSSGVTKTDSTTFSQADIEDAGFSGPYTKPEFDSSTHYIRWNKSTLSYDIFELDKLTDDQILTDIRNRRNQILFYSDWRLSSDSPLTEQEKEKWRIYRQKLRDLPQDIEDVHNFEWPEL